MARVEVKTNTELHHMSRAGIITSRALDARQLRLQSPE